MKSQHCVGQCSIEFPRPPKVTIAEILAGIVAAAMLGGMLGYALFMWVTL